MAKNPGLWDIYRSGARTADANASRHMITRTEDATSRQKVGESDNSFYVAPILVAIPLA